MRDPILDPLAAELDARGPALTATRAAALLDLDRLDTGLLVRRIRRDRRFLVLDAGPPLPGYDAWPDAARARYAPALARVDLPDRRIVMLRDAGAGRPRTPSTADLMGDTVRQLVALRSVGARRARRIAAAAYRCQAALAGVTPPAPAADPSTTPPPGPPPPA